MPAALKMVREALGDNAVILSTQQKRGKQGVTIIAAQEASEDPLDSQDVIPAPAPISSAAAEKIRAELQAVLRFHNVPEHLLPKIFSRTDPRELASIEALQQLGSKQESHSFLRLGLEKTMSHFFQFQPLQPEGADKRLMLVGPPGVGKTLTIAKLATRTSLAGKPLAVFTTDTKRAGGIEQLKAFTDILGVELRVAESPTALASMVKGVPLGMHVLVDTAGGNPFDATEMKEIATLAYLEGIEPVLTLACGGDAMEAMDVGQAFARLPIRRLLITRTDSARRYGAVVAVAAANQLAFCNISTSASTIEPLVPMDSAQLTKLLLRYQLQSP